jgi:hypothetical protein
LAIAFENPERRSQPTPSSKQQLTKVFASFFKKKCFFLFFFEKKNQKTFIPLVLASGRSVLLHCHAKKIPNAIPLPGPAWLQAACHRSLRWLARKCRSYLPA